MVQEGQIMEHKNYQKIVDLAKAIDAWRIFPRAFILTYMYILIKVVHWFMALDKPSMEQAGLVSIVVGAGAAWFGLYTNSGSKVLSQPHPTVVQQPAPKPVVSNVQVNP
jgi:hypothetical protein